MTTLAPAASSATPAASPCMRPSGAVGRIRSLFARGPRSAVRTVKSPASASTSSQRRLSAGRTNTSQKRSIAASEVPSRRSSAPNVSPGVRARVPTAGRNERDPDAVSQRQVAIAQQRAQPRLDCRDRPVRVEHGQGEPHAQVRAALADPLEEAQVLGEAAERDVLAVVGRRLRIALAVGQRLDGAAERRPSLVDGDGMPGVDQVERRGQPRQAAADDRDLHGRSPRATTASLRGVESRVFSPKTSKPLASIRSSVSR